MKILFVNADAAKPQCAIYQAGKAAYDALRLSKAHEFSYFEITSGVTEHMPDPTPYDAVLFNYQHVSMSMVPIEYFFACRRAIGYLYEARKEPQFSPTHFGPSINCDRLFTQIITPDPTLRYEDFYRRIISVPRIVPRAPVWMQHNDPVWVGTFGFPSPWKALDEVIMMMNEEFEHAVFRLNFAHASHQEGTPLHDMMMDSIDNLKKLAHPGIEVRVTTDYLDDSALIRWLAENDVNVFLAKEERSIQTGGALLASTDMAIAAQRPILVSRTEEARHLQLCATGSIKKAIAHTMGYVEQYYEDWSPEKFARSIDRQLRE